MGKMAPFALALLLLPFGGCMRKSAKRLGRVMSLLLLIGASISAMAGLTGCGASVNSNFVQPQQTYDLTVTIRQKIWGRDHPDTAYSLNNLGWIYLELGRWQLAEPLLKENLAIPRAPSARAGPLYVSSLANWGRVLEQKGDYSGAADAFNQAMQLLASGGHQESWSGPKSWTIRSFSISIAAAIRMQSGWPRVRCRWRGTWAATTIRS